MSAAAALSSTWCWPCGAVRTRGHRENMQVFPRLSPHQVGVGGFFVKLGAVVLWLDCNISQRRGGSSDSHPPMCRLVYVTSCDSKRERQHMPQGRVCTSQAHAPRCVPHPRSSQLYSCPGSSRSFHVLLDQSPQHTYTLVKLTNGKKRRNNAHVLSLTPRSMLPRSSHPSASFQGHAHPSRPVTEYANIHTLCT